MLVATRGPGMERDLFGAVLEPLPSSRFRHATPP